MKSGHCGHGLTGHFSGGHRVAVALEDREWTDVLVIEAAASMAAGVFGPAFDRADYGKEENGDTTIVGSIEVQELPVSEGDQ